MSPFIRNGDILTVQPIEAAALRLGDVAFYRTAEDRLTAHRVVGKERHGGLLLLRLRGDAAAGPDERIEAGQVLGRVMSLQRGTKIVRLDRPGRRLAAFLWIVLSPASQHLLMFARMLKKRLLSPVRRARSRG